MCLSTDGGIGAIPACIAGGIPVCLAAGLQGGLPAPRGVPATGGGGAWSLGGLVWPSVMAFCCGLLLCPSVMAFWFGCLLIEGDHLVWSGGGSHNRRHHTRRPYQKAITEDHFQPEGRLQSEGHYTRRPYQKAITEDHNKRP